MGDDNERQAEPATNTLAAAEMGAGAPAETPKVSMMAKVGTNFVIPKNKALVPVTRSSTKWEPLEPKKEELKPLSRKTKWGPDLTQEPVVKRGRALALQTRAEQLAAQLESNSLEIDNNEATRSPSPPPLYDSLGHRMNTREGRKREQLDVERREAIGECMKLNPSYKPPSGFRPVPKEAKLFIPVKENPGYNFIGLILGPRGNTQKRLEAETGCKITIRGKGSIKEGKLLPYRHGKDNDGAFEDLHVHVSADTYEKVDAAVAIVEPLLIPVDEDRNIYKMKQLRELAEMNGTVRDFMRICTLCGEEGHREWQCPKDKLQTFQSKVICRLCGDGSHPTMDCPLKISGQGRAIDKEYLSFLEELGAGLGGIDPPAKPDFVNRVQTAEADNSQPMLLTASGAQPMPARWMASATGSESDSGMASDGSNEIGGFPKFPFPFPFPPAGPHGMNPLNFLPRFFHPALFGLFRGRPLSGPSMQMMAFMLSAFRGRFPFPPFGFRPNMMRPPMPPPSAPEGVSSWMPVEMPMSGQSQTSEFVAEGATENNPEAFTSLSGTFDTSEKDHTSVGVPVTVSAEVPSFLSSSLPFPPSATASPVSKSTLVFEIAAVSPPTTFSSSINSVPMFSSVSTPNVLPPEMPSSGYPISPVPPQPVLPSFRPLPSVRPVVPPVVQSPSFTHLEGSGLAPPAAPSWAGTSSITSLSGLDNLYKPSQRWGSSASWSQSQYSTEPFLTSPLDKPTSEYASSQFFPTLSTLNPLPPRIDSSYSFNAGKNSDLVSTAGGSGSLSFPTLNPPNIPTQFGSFASRSVPFGTPTMPLSFTPGLSQISQGQFGVPVNNQPKDYSFSSRLGPPPVLGPQYRSIGLVNAAAPPVEDYHSFSSLSQRSFLPPDAHASSRMQIARDHHYSSTFPASEFSYARPREPFYPGSAGSCLHAESRDAEVYHSGRVGQRASSFDNQEFQGSTMTLPSEAFGNNERPYRYDPSIPLPILQQNAGSVHEPWNANLHSRSRLGVQHAWEQPESGGGSRWNRSPQNAGLRLQEGDPEYEKLMSSVGVL